MVPTTSGFAVSVASNFTEWQDLVSRSFVSLDVCRGRPRPFRGDMRGGSVAGVHLCEITASSHTVRRTPALIASDDRAYFKLSLQLAGTGLLIQDGREAVLSHGDLAVYDTARPYTLTFDDEFRALVLMFPRESMCLPVDAVRQLTAVRMSARVGLGRMVNPFLERLAADLDQIAGTSGPRLAHNALDLVGTMFADQLGSIRVPADPHRDLANRIRSYIEANLADPELCPTKIAAAHFISTRQLHHVFHAGVSNADGMTVAAWIRSQRLERCRRDLVDPVHRGRSIAALAARWGFLDAAHFSRVFKAAYEVPPSSYRLAGGLG